MATVSLWPVRIAGAQDASPAAADEAQVQREPADPATEENDATVRVAGLWTGTVLNGKLRFKTVWSLRQAGEHLSGWVSFTQIGSSDYAKYALAGRVTGDTVTYQMTNFLSHAAKRNPPLTFTGWCLPAGHFLYSVENGVESLAGRFRENSVSGGCPRTVKASMRLKRVEPE